MRDLTGLFTKTRVWNWGLVLTFDLHPSSFFETEILSKLTIQKNLTIVMDASNLRRLLEKDTPRPRFTGVYYNLEGVSIRGGGCFHPKLYLLASDTDLWMAVGSFNLTDTGFKRNLELLTEIEISKSTMGHEDTTLLAQLSTFLRSAFLEENPLIEGGSEALRVTITEMLSSSILKEGTATEAFSASGCAFISSIHSPLFEQVCNLTGCRSFRKIEALSPFFDADASGIRHLLRHSKELELYIPDNRSSFPAALFSKTEALNQIPVFTVRSEVKGLERFCHAKLYRFQGLGGSWTLLTSANLSQSGMVNAGYPRNLEIGVLFSEKKRGSFPGIPNASIERVSDFSLINLAGDDPQAEEGEDIDPETPRIASAFYDGKYVNFQMASSALKDSSERLLATLWRDGISDKSVPVAANAGKLRFEPDLEIEGGIPIELVVKSADESWETSAFPIGRLVHQPNQLPALGTSAFNACLRLGGESGVREAFKLAEGSGREDWLLYLLTHWDLEKILRGVDAQAENSDQEEEDEQIPAFPHKNHRDYSVQKLRQNITLLADSDVLHERLKGFIERIPISSSTSWGSCPAN